VKKLQLSLFYYPYPITTTQSFIKGGAYLKNMKDTHSKPRKASKLVALATIAGTTILPFVTNGCGLPAGASTKNYSRTPRTTVSLKDYSIIKHKSEVPEQEPENVVYFELSMPKTKAITQIQIGEYSLQDLNKDGIVDRIIEDSTGQPIFGAEGYKARFSMNDELIKITSLALKTGNDTLEAEEANFQILDTLYNEKTYEELHGSEKR